MSDPLSVAREIAEVMDDMEKATWEYGGIADRAGHSEVVHKVAFARARLAATGTVGDREAKAMVDTEKVYFERKAAEAAHDAQKQVLLTLRARLDGLRTLSANVRTQT